MTALVSPLARIGSDVRIGHATRIHANARIGDGSVIGDFCIIGHPSAGASEAEPATIGPGAHIRSHTVIYEASRFGPRLETGHHVVIREGTAAGENLRVGNFTDVEGNCEIGDFCRFHGYVHVGKGTRIGNFVWLFSLSTHTNDPLPPSAVARPVTIDDGAVVCVGATVMPGTRIRLGAFIAAGAHASGDIPAGAVVVGPEGRVINHVSRLMDLGSGLRHPWMRHYHEAFPPQAQERLATLMQNVMASKAELDAGRR